MTSSGPSWHCRHYISLTAVLEFGPAETLPPVGAISKHPGVSADAVAKPSAQTRAESRVLDLRKRLRKRDRLSAGGGWIRTSGTAPGFWPISTRTTRRDRCRKKGVRIRRLLVFAALGREWWA